MLQSNLNDDVNTTILLNTNMDDMKNICYSNKYFNQLCHKVHFWHTKFKNDNLPLPPINFKKIEEWIDCYQFTLKMMSYVNVIIDNYINKKINVKINYVHDLSIFKSIVHPIILSTWYHMWYKASKNYFTDIHQRYDDTQPHGILVISSKYNMYQLALTVGQFTLASGKMEYDDVKKIIYHFISHYQYPYYENVDGYWTMVPF